MALIAEGMNLMSTLFVPPIWATAPSVSLIPALRFSEITLPRISGSQRTPRPRMPLYPDCLM